MTTMAQTGLENRKKTRLDLIGSYCEVMWSATNRMAKNQCSKCVYLVRGIEPGLICLELVYDAIEGVHRHDAIYWVPSDALQYLRVLDEKAAERRIEALEKEVYEDKPRD
jgi:hypothetical protein